MHLFADTPTSAIYYWYYMNQSARSDMKALNEALLDIHGNPIRTINGSESIPNYPILCNYLEQNEDSVYVGVNLLDWDRCPQMKSQLDIKCLSFGKSIVSS